MNATNAMTAKKTDPITLEVVRGGIVSLCQEMGLSMERSSYSPVFSEGLDYSFALFDGGGEMISQAAFDPCHLGAMPQAVRKTLDQVGTETIEPGDVFLNNDPYLGGSHCSDYTFMRPVFSGRRIVAIAAARAHMIDVGASVPGSFAGDTTEIHQEGLRLPAIKLLSRGQEVSDLWRLILTNVRVSRAFEGDMRAVLGALKVAERRVLEYSDNYGVDTWETILGSIKDISEAVVRRELSKLPEGSYSYEDYVDDSGNTSGPIKIRVKVKIKDGTLLADYSGSSPQARGPINCAFAVTLGNTYIGTLHCLPIHGEYQLNAGTFRPIKAEIPPGTVTNATYPAPVQGGNTETSNRIVDVMIGALSQAVPEENVKASCHGTCSGLTGGDIHGRPEDQWVMYLWGLGGMGARIGKDGNPAQMPFATNNKGPVIEIQDTRYPLLTERFELSSPDSCGAGKYRGGMGTVYGWRLLAPEAELSSLSERHKISPYGVFGGLPPSPLSCGHFCDTRLTPAGAGTFGHATDLFGKLSPSKWSNIILHSGDKVELNLTGGGGYGDPLERDPARVASDVRNRYVSVEGAMRLYGVIVKGDFTVDADATHDLRAKLRDGNVPFDVSHFYEKLSTLAWLLTRSEETLGRLGEAARNFPGVIRFVADKGDPFHYGKVLASNPYVIRRLVSSMKDSDVKIHTIQYFSKESKIEDLM
ncbi:MAG: hydantoinase B/oxoprolinase family protein [Thaumarchaeota archaeon]|nr:hydantoinase B/oxoprolinase family protein [Nitrososphaerota archaeon]